METASSSNTFFSRFESYFSKEIAQKAAAPLADGVEIEFTLPEEKFHFTRENRKNVLKFGPAIHPQFCFSLPASSAEDILSDPSENIPEIGIRILKLILSPDANRRIGVQLKTGFMDLFSKGYFGVLAVGGAEFMTFLASKGFNGIGAIKDALTKLKKQ